MPLNHQQFHYYDLSCTNVLRFLHAHHYIAINGFRFYRATSFSMEISRTNPKAIVIALFGHCFALACSTSECVSIKLKSWESFIGFCYIRKDCEFSWNEFKNFYWIIFKIKSTEIFFSKLCSWRRKSNEIKNEDSTMEFYSILFFAINNWKITKIHIHSHSFSQFIGAFA